ncbi:MAG: hypothetical protein V5A57_01625 [Candidatus Paceibacterota bacterium]
MLNNEKIDLSDVGDSDSSSPSLEESAPSKFQPGTPILIRWVIKFSGGMIENERQADYLLIGFTILITIISLFLVFSIFKESPRQEPYRPDTKYGGQENPEQFE